MVVDMPVRMFCDDTGNENCKRRQRHINSLYEYLNGLLLPFKFALWFFSPMPYLLTYLLHEAESFLRS